MTQFVLNNNCFDSDGSIQQQLSGTAIGTKFSPPTLAFLWINLKLTSLKLKHYDI